MDLQIFALCRRPRPPCTWITDSRGNGYSHEDIPYKCNTAVIANRLQASQTGFRHRTQAADIAARQKASETAHRHRRQAIDIAGRPEASQAGCKSHRQTVFCMLKLSVYFVQIGPPPTVSRQRLLGAGWRPVAALSKQCLVGADCTPSPPYSVQTVSASATGRTRLCPPLSEGCSAEQPGVQLGRGVQ